MKISIAQAKKIREELGVTHLVIFAVEESGTQHVATHGDTQVHARESAQASNHLKAFLGWLENLCKDSPLPRKCKNCVYYKPDYGIHCFNGWSSDGSKGFCRLEPAQVGTSADSLCRHFEPNS